MKRITGGTTVLIMVLAAAAAGAAGMVKINADKKEYAAEEAKLPESAITSYFKRLKDGDYEGVYEDSMVVAPHLNSEADYVAKLQSTYENIDPSDIQYTEIDEEDGALRYKLYHDGEYLATLKLIQSSDGTWLASTVFSGSEDYQVEVPEGLSITVNGVSVGDEYIIGRDLVTSNFQGLADTTDAPRVNVYEFDNLMSKPEIAVEGDSSYGTIEDVVSGHLLVGKTNDDPDLQNTFIQYSRTLSSYPAKEGSMYDVQAITITGSDFWNRYSGMANTWFTTHGTSEFSNQNAYNIVQQSDNTAVGYVTFDYYASNGEVDRTWYGGIQLSLMQVNGTWKIAGTEIDNELNEKQQARLDAFNAAQ